MSGTVLSNVIVRTKGHGANAICGIHNNGKTTTRTAGFCNSVHRVAFEIDLSVVITSYGSIEYLGCLLMVGGFGLGGISC